MGRHSERLLAPGAIGLFAIGVSVVLVVLFPRERIMSQLVNLHHPDMVAVTFLRNLVKHDPENVRLRILMANQLWKLGEIQAAGDVMTPLLASTESSLRLEALLFELKRTEVMAFAAPEGTAQRVAGQIRMGKIVETLLAEGVDQRHLPGLAESALLSGHPLLAYAMYGQLAAQAGTQAGPWFAQAGRLALAQGWYRRAADSYFAAQARASTIDHQRTYFIKALQSLQAGNLLAEALVEAENHVHGLQTDDTTLEFLVRLGREAGNGHFAQKYVTLLLRQPRLDLAQTPALSRDVPATSWSDLAKPSVGQSPALWAGQGIWAQSRSSKSVPTRMVVMRESEAGSGEVAATQPVSFRPFNDPIYTLAYQVFVENQNLTDAYRVASQAVEEAPTHWEWRRRLAQVAEWTGRPLVALAQWRRLAEQNPDRQILERIRELAPGAYDDESLVFALTRLEALGVLPDEDWRKLSDAFERIGQPEEAIRYLLQKYDTHPELELLEHVAFVYTRMGQGAAALSVYEELERVFGLTLPWAMHMATLHARQGRLTQAYDALLSVKQQAVSSNESYWSQLAQLAWILQEDAQAEQAYRLLWKRDRLSSEQRYRLIQLVQVSNPGQAIDLSLEGWASHRQPMFFIKALDLLIQGKQWMRATRILHALSSADAARLSDLTGYWTMRAEILWKGGDPKAALQAYQEALSRDPESSTVRVALLWFLVEHRQLAGLRSYLTKWAADIRDDSRLWEPVAAAYQLLDQPKRALPFFRLALPDHARDYLWLLNFAQTLDAATQHAKAWQVRRYVWIHVRQQLLTRLPAPLTPEGIQAYVELAWQREPTDRFHRWVRRMVTHQPSPVIQEMLLAWLLSKDHHDAARWWMWKNYAKALAQPAWASLAVALEANDWVAIDRVVTAQAQNLITQDAIVASHHLHRFPMAQTQAFDALGEQPDRTSFHRLFQDATITQADRFDSKLTVMLRDPLSRYQATQALTFNLGRFTVKPEIRTIWQSSTDTSALVGVPRVDQTIGGTLGYQFAKSRLEFTGQFRRAVSNFAAYQLRYQQNWTDHFVTSFNVGRNQPPDDSVALVVAGVKDVIQAQGAYRFAKREFVEIQLDAPWFFSQHRDKLGRGFGVEGTIGHRFRVEYPDWSIRMLGRVQRYSREKRLPASMARVIPGTLTPTVDLIVPQSFEQGGVLLSVGDSIRETFPEGRGLRVFGTVGGNYNSIFGVGYSVEGGLTTRLLGRDRLLLSGSHIKGGFGRNSTTTQFTLHYQWLF